MTLAAPDPVRWHDLECGGYAADLPLWRELAAQAGGPVLDVGCGTGRVTLDLAARGHAVTGLDRDPALLAALGARARDLPVVALEADARAFDLPARFALVVVPMQTVQLLGGREGRLAFLRCARRALRPRGVLAAALAVDLERFEPDSAALPPPDMTEAGGWVLSSQPVAVRSRGDRVAIHRVRQAVDPAGRLRREDDVVELDEVAPGTLAAEGAEAGLTPLTPLRIAATPDHVGSEVVVLRA